MSAPPFQWVESFFGNTDLVKREKMQIAPSLSVVRGQLLKLDANGKLALATDTAVVDYVAAEDGTSTSTSATFIKVSHAGKGLAIWEAPLQLITGTTDPFCTVAGSTTTAVFACTAGVDQDMVGGIVHFPLLGKTRKITANVYSGGNCTVTFIEPLDGATATTDKIRVNIFGRGDKLIQLDNTAPSLGIGGAVIADKTGGKVTCYEIDMDKKVGRFTFNPS